MRGLRFVNEFAKIFKPGSYNKINLKGKRVLTQIKMETDKQLVEFEKSKKYAIKNQDVLRRAYGVNYFAMVDKLVVDSDKNEFELAKRMYTKFPDKFVFISNLENILNPKTFTMESPEEVLH
ncbi:MAG: hypothetical protein AABW67_00970 [Nanoarchaeota archaeon]